METKKTKKKSGKANSPANKVKKAAEQLADKRKKDADHAIRTIFEVLDATDMALGVRTHEDNKELVIRDNITGNEYVIAETRGDQPCKQME